MRQSEKNTGIYERSERQYLAHIDKISGRKQGLHAHLENVSVRSGDFAAAFGEEAMGRLVGAYHDIGKYSNEFQDYIRASEEEQKKKHGKIDHSTAGAKEIAQLGGAAPVLALCIAGHHGGIPDLGTKVDTAAESTLVGRLKKEVPDYHSYREENAVPLLPASSLFSKVSHIPFSTMLYTRMLFSCLVDGDFLDTEYFMSGGTVERSDFPSMEVLLERLQSAFREKYFAPQSVEVQERLNEPINRKRMQLLQESIAAGKSAKGQLYRMNIPTGGGKTISSLAFALHYAVHAAHKRRRVIYVIPYTSIIEQTAKVFRELLDSDCVVEHHQNVDYDDTTDEMNRKRLAAENWDAPIIVTTNVQFFESLFSNRPSKCRKLHNIAESIIIFDEAQMIPIEFLRPCMEVVQDLVRHYACTAVLCTATQPPLEKIFADDIQPIEICPHVMENAAFFQRAKIRMRVGMMIGDLAAELEPHGQVLCIVNLKRTAQEVFERMEEKEGTYQLSTNLYPVHRAQVLEEIRERLRAGKPCRVISTSLVEAGVDLDFPCVYREMNGLDSIIQAAGRCNRENKRTAEESIVHVFSLEDVSKKSFLPADTTRIVARSYGEDLGNPRAIRMYFNELYDLGGERRLDQKKVMEISKKLSFAEVAEKFRLIEEQTTPVLIPEAYEAKALLQRLEGGERTRSLMRKAARYMVSLRPSRLDGLVRQGKIRMLDEEFAVLEDMSVYDRKQGLKEDV
ncbi:CRISPR-associated protein Cas3 [Selenomonas sp. oral taxon 126]|uniref:CRISPR-associated helicase/endonuclease Cas3 n=1 Tax=Selenomonas sp. oral taxon 126 TaxID=712528 RepID=UPI00080779D5|nr:CRISPR-associated helicase/endonuclease Cas3 [Selenomonas sp. oral taxon 126]ANR71046.1 CRISPR-associated protein Cas3 [Selenomonas sp. oral taxon 126]